jgi:hypothetical protein
MRPLSVTVGPNAAAGTPSSMLRMDEWADAPLGVQVSVQGTVTFAVEHSFDDPNDLINPVPIGSMYWGTDLVPLAAQGGAGNNITFSMATAPLWMRLVLNTGNGSARLTVVQYNVVEG